MAPVGSTQFSFFRSLGKCGCTPHPMKCIPVRIEYIWLGGEMATVNYYIILYRFDQPGKLLQRFLEKKYNFDDVVIFINLIDCDKFHWM